MSASQQSRRRVRHSQTSHDLAKDPSHENEKLGEDPHKRRTVQENKVNTSEIEEEEPVHPPSTSSSSKLGDEDDKVQYTFAFGSAGWLFVYYFGVIKALRTCKMNRNFRCVGTSGGALAASAGLCLESVEVDDVKDFILHCAREARSSWRGLFKLRTYCQGAIDRFCKEEDVENISGRVEVSMTVLPFLKNKRVRKFEGHKHLTQCLHASSCLIPLSGLPVKVDGVGYCIDGGVSDFQLLKGLAVGGTFFKVHDRSAHKSDTIIVCPFYSSRADIKPSRYIPPWWAFFPPGTEELQGVYILGYNDAMDYIRKNPHHIPDDTDDWLLSLYETTSTMYSAVEHTAHDAAEYLSNYMPSMPEMPPMPEAVNEQVNALSSSFQANFPSLYEAMPSFQHLSKILKVEDFEVPQCLSDLGMNLSGPMFLIFSTVRQVFVVITAILVYLELMIQAFIWGCATGASVVIPGVSTSKYGPTWLQLVRTAASPRLALRAMPVIGRFVKMHPIKVQRLEDLSVVFRLLAFVMIDTR